MNRIIKLFFLLLTLSFTAPVQGQCSSGRCPIPGYSSQPRFGQPPQFAQPPDFTQPPSIPPSVDAIDQKVLEAVRLASVRVKGRISQRTTGYGSGTVFKYYEQESDGTLICHVGILTAGHVVQDAFEVSIIHPSFGEIPVNVLVQNPSVDYAILEPMAHQEELFELGVPLYSGNALPGNTSLIMAGYMDKSVVTIRTGTLINYTTSNGNRFSLRQRLIFIEGDVNDIINPVGIRPILGFLSRRAAGENNWMRIYGTARNGDSGGGILTQDGKLVGNIWGSDMQNEVVGTWIAPAAYEMVDKVCVFNWFKKKPSRPINPNPSNPNPPEKAPELTPPDVEKPKPEVIPPSTEQPKPEAKPIQPKPEQPKPSLGQQILDLIWPSVLVLITYITYMVSIGITYIILYRRS